MTLQIGVTGLFSQKPRHFLAVFISPAAEIDDDDLVFGKFGSQLCQVRKRVGGFQGRQNALKFGNLLKCFQRLGVGDADVGDSASVFPVGVFGADAGIVEASRDAVDVGGLAVFVLQDVGERAVKDAGPAGAQGGGVLAKVGAATAGFDADEFDRRIAGEGVRRFPRRWIRRRRRRARNPAVGLRFPGIVFSLRRR